MTDMQISFYQRNKINRVINFIRTHVDEKHSLDMLADVACISKYHFINVFSNYCRETPFQFISRIRLEHAIDKLVYFPKQPITQIAFNCGFDDPRSFSRAFQKRFQICARSYRKANAWRFDLFPENQIRGEQELKKLNMNFPDIGRIEKNIELRNMPDTRLAYIRHIGLYQNKNYRTDINESYKKLKRWAQNLDLWQDDSALIGITPNHPAITPSRYCIYDVALPVCNNVTEDNVVSIQSMPGSNCVVLTLVTNIAGVHAAWDWLISSWLPGSGMTRAQYAPCFERRQYFSIDPRSDEFLIELWMPVIRENETRIL